MDTGASYVLFYVFTNILYLSSGFPNGAPYQACCHMIPGHVRQQPQNTPPPFNVTVSHTSYDPGDTIVVTLSSPIGRTFEGFLLQARRADPTQDTVTLIGSFNTNDAAVSEYATCGTNHVDDIGTTKKTAVTQTSQALKPSVEFNWITPTRVGHIVFRCTFVENYSKFWVAVNSPIIRDKSVTGPLTFTERDVADQTPCDRGKTTNPVTTLTTTTTEVTNTTTPVTTTTTPTTTNTEATTTVETATVATTTVETTNVATTTVATTTVGTTTVATPTESAVTLGRGADCYKTQGCFDDCDDKGENCGSTLAWRKVGNFLEYELQAVIPDGNYWMAVGFSHDQYMANTSVLECVRFGGGQTGAFSSFNSVYSYANVRNPQNIFSGSPQISYTNGIMKCVMSLPFEEKHYPQKWFFHLPKGPAQSDGTLSKHTVVHTAKISVQLSDITTRIPLSNGVIKPTPTTVPPVTAPDAERLTRDTQCGVTRGCLDDCGPDGRCTIVASWEYKGNNSARIYLSSRPNTDKAWMAMGFSGNNKMDATSVVECVRHNGVTHVHTSYNQGYNNARTDKDNGLKLVGSTFRDGMFRCTMDIVNHDRGKSKMVDLVKDWYMILAQGKAHDDGTKVEHSASPLTSLTRLNLKVTGLVKQESRSNYMVKIHACVMLAAWIFTSSIGIYIARYYKPVWPDSVVCAGKQAWFVLHILCVGLTTVATVAAFCVIFVDVGGYSQMGQESRLVAAHPIVGIIVTALVVINPVVALFRCKPDAAKRSIFNWIHRGIGMSAWILANVAIFSAFHIDRVRVPQEAVYIWYAYIAYQLVGALIQEALSFCANSTAKRHANYTFDVNKQEDDLQETKSSAVWCGATRTILLVVHTFVVAAFFTALVIMVMSNELDSIR